ncbi:MAG TPA: zf-HC2 domain-containing protein, partial [Usitatibacter sp.]|nr:zf-HC2 domain-containing protein [Usitatibacter sp.]
MSPEPLHPTREDLFAYRDGELTADRRILIEAHVLTCRSCREVVDEVSALEAALRARPDTVGDAYFDRMTESVMRRIGSGAAPAPIPIDRRKSGADPEVEGKRAHAPKLPWAILVSAGSAAAAVLVVAVFLVREGTVWTRAPHPVALERSAGDAARLKAEAESTSAAPMKDERQAALDRKQSAGKKTAPSGGSKMLAEERGRDEAFQKMGAQQEPLEKPSAAADRAARAPAVGSAAALAPLAASPEAAKAMGGAAPPAAPTYQSVIQRYGLPPVWGPGVSDEMILRAEPALRNLYRVGGASEDSARVRLYLAEATRIRAGSAPDSTAIDEIARHYRRAIGLARDPETASVARSRLMDFLREVGKTP